MPEINFGTIFVNPVTQLNFMAKFGTSFSQRTEQIASPLQIQLMRLLRVPDVQLDSVIEKELEQNELLEVDTSAEENEEWPQRELYAYNSPRKDEVQYPPVEYKPTLFDFLDQQLGTLEWEDDFDRTIAEHLLGSIGSSGYLGRNLDAIQHDILLDEYVEVPLGKIESVLRKVQQLDPAGIGARDTRECLLIQLGQLLDQEEHPLPVDERQAYQDAYRILDKHFDAYSRHQYDRIESSLGLSKEALKAADEKIKLLNPRPASGYSVSTQNESIYVVPDFIVDIRDGEPIVSLYNQNTPRLRINDFYAEMLQSMKGDGRIPEGRKEEYTYIKQKVDAAKWFIEAIRQRQDTLLRTMRAIVQYQHDYFLSGDIQDLRPMIYKDIAAITKLDISTISRVVNQKFVQTEFGTKRLKDFFSESITTSDGEEVSNLEVKEKLKELIDTEDKKRPLSDQKLADLLKEAGYPIARRTVAKYREEHLGIPKAGLRKEI